LFRRHLWQSPPNGGDEPIRIVITVLGTVLALSIAIGGLNSLLAVLLVMESSPPMLMALG
jgi:hypothetical protein